MDNVYSGKEQNWLFLLNTQVPCTHLCTGYFVHWPLSMIINPYRTLQWFYHSIAWHWAIVHHRWILNDRTQCQYFSDYFQLKSMSGIRIDYQCSLRCHVSLYWERRIVLRKYYIVCNWKKCSIINHSIWQILHLM
jgi:hypothetical protein